MSDSGSYTLATFDLLTDTTITDDERDRQLDALFESLCSEIPIG